MLIGAFGHIKIAEITIQELKQKQDDLRHRISIKPKSALLIQKTEINIKKPDFTKIEFDRDLLNISYLDCSNYQDNSVLLNNFIQKSQQTIRQYKTNSDIEFQNINSEPPPNQMKSYVKEAQVRFVKSEINEGQGEPIPQSSFISDDQLVFIINAFNQKNINITFDQIKMLIDMLQSSDIDKLIEGYNILFKDQ